MVDSQYYLPNDIGISVLDCAEAFRLLSPKEQLYAHYLSQASWYGGLVVLLQTSPESPSIYVLLQRIFRKQTPAQLDAVAAAAGLSSDEYQVRNGLRCSQLVAVQYEHKYQYLFLFCIRHFLCMLLDFMQTWETTSHLVTRSSSPICQR